jgi:hypothetical protein
MTETTAPAAATETVINGRTAAEWEALAVGYEAQAQACVTRSAESFERCDTDGFLSQWAADSTAREYRAKAEWAREHGYVTTRALFDTDGQVLSTHEHEGRWGECWVLRDDAAERFGKRFVTLSKATGYAKQAKANRKKGFVEVLVKVAGYVALAGSSRTSVAPRSFPDIDALRADEFEVVHPDFLMKLSEMWDATDGGA